MPNQWNGGINEDCTSGEDIRVTVQQEDLMTPHTYGDFSRVLYGSA